jgi:enterochelin esterase family protein
MTPGLTFARLALLATLVVPSLQSARVEPATYASAVFGGTRRMLVYAPPSDVPGPPVGLLVCLWGQDYVGPIAAPATLDTLIRERRVPPLIAVFLDDGDDRFQDFQTTTRIGRSVAEEVIPWVRSSRHLNVDAAHIIVAGYSAAGLAAAYTAFTHADTVGNVLAQSGAFWRGFDGQGASAPEWITAQVTAEPRRAVRFSLEVGGAETRAAGGSAVSIKTANEHLHEALVKKGYAVAYAEVPGGQHEYGHWQAAFGPALVALTREWR